MPDLSVFDDLEELDNRYINKSVVYVEGKDDKKVWEHIVGSDAADRLEFKVPPHDGGGSETVIQRVREERRQNSNIHGLVDGEVAATYGKVDQLINCTDTMFTLDIIGFEGILFMCAHELENIIVCHSSIVTFVANNVRFKQIGTRNVVTVEKQLATFARRFYIAALFKYTSAHLYATNKNFKILNVSRFMSNENIFAVIKSTKKDIFDQQVIPISHFMKQLFMISKTIRKLTKFSGASQKECDLHITRLADGKGLFNKITSHWKINKANEGHLVEHVRRSQFAENFREELISITTI